MVQELLGARACLREQAACADRSGVHRCGLRLLGRDVHQCHTGIEADVVVTHMAVVLRAVIICGQVNPKRRGRSGFEVAIGTHTLELGLTTALAVPDVCRRQLRFATVGTELRHVADRRKRQAASRCALDRGIVFDTLPLFIIRRRSAHAHRHALGHGLDRNNCRANTRFGRGSILNGGNGKSILRIGLQPVPGKRGLRIVGDLPAVDDGVGRVTLQHTHAVAKATPVCEHVVPAKRDTGRINGVCRKARHGRCLGHLDILDVIAHDPKLIGVLGAEFVARAVLELVDIHRVDAQAPRKAVLILRGLGQVVDGAAVFGRFTRGVTRSKAGVGTKAQAAK